MAKRRKTGEHGIDRASHVARSQRPLAIVEALRQEYGNATCALTHSNAFELTVATILSAQCTDERVNQATPELFRTYPTPQLLANAEVTDIERIIKPLGFFRAKAANLMGMAQRVVNEFGGEMPRNLEDLVTLPGVGRKTANVVLGTAFGIPSGVVVDTHVKRITHLLGLTRNTDPVKIEKDLVELIPKPEWIDFSHRLIHHGRRVCIARRPQCTKCVLLNLCDRIGLPPLENPEVS